MKPNPLPAALMALALTPLAAQAVQLPLIADTYLAAANQGAAGFVNINPTNKGLLQFDLSALPAGTTSKDVAKATLVFFVKTAPQSGPITVSPVASAWSEKTATTANAPLINAPLATSASISNSNSNSYFAVDVTALVLNWVDFPARNFGLALAPVTTASLTLDSKEATLTSHPAYIDLVLKGPAGAVGATGKTGPQGPQGATGPQGPTGTLPPGNNAGDMRYWNGKAWVLVPAATAGIPTATLQFCKGKPVWGACSYSIGDTGPAGGKVFYLTDATGLHGLEAAPVDQSAGIPWGCAGTTPGTTGTAIGTGKANTTAINAKCRTGTGTAAQVAASYSLNGFADWYLPSKDELNLLYQQKAVVGGLAVSAYWSSSEYDNNNAWGQYFGGGYQLATYKSDSPAVRAIRSF